MGLDVTIGQQFVGEAIMHKMNVTGQVFRLGIGVESFESVARFVVWVFAGLIFQYRSILRQFNPKHQITKPQNPNYPGKSGGSTAIALPYY